jgi:hypothetical protein
MAYNQRMSANIFPRRNCQAAGGYARDEEHHTLHDLSVVEPAKATMSDKVVPARA